VPVLLFHLQVELIALIELIVLSLLIYILQIIMLFSISRFTNGGSNYNVQKLQLFFKHIIYENDSGTGLSYGTSDLAQAQYNI
jgi:hypothetical protein